jgi:choline dehydrogenase-like flavoprotein
MRLDARNMTSDECLDADVCIVGGGVAGLVLAGELQPAGLRVLVLEGGGETEDDATNDLSRGENAGRAYDQLTAARHRRLGGGSNLWDIELGEGQVGPRLRALDAIDFEKRDWVPHSGWPFGKEHLDPFYREAHRLLRLGEPDSEAEAWSDPSVTPPFPLRADRVRSTVFQFARRELFFEEFYRRLLGSPNVTVVLHANVTGLEQEAPGSRVTHARVATLSGKRFRVAARTFVLAAGGTENPRLLLSSTSASPNGVGNEHDQVGRFFMEHPHFRPGWIVPRSRRQLGQAQFYRIHRVRGVPVMAKLAIAEQALRAERLLNYCCALRPRFEAVTPGIHSLSALRGGNDHAGQASRRRLAADLAGNLGGVLGYALDRAYQKVGGPERPNVFRLSAMTEQAPNPESRVTLSFERDALGERRVRLEWRLSPPDIESIGSAGRILEEEVRRAGLGRMVSALDSEGMPPRIVGGWHHMGTTRMHEDPRHGVVDADCRVHGAPNLFVAGSSVFPTSGYANPTLTIVALALRLARHLRERPGETVRLGAVGEAGA